MDLLIKYASEMGSYDRGGCNQGWGVQVILTCTKYNVKRFKSEIAQNCRLVHRNECKDEKQSST